MAIIVMVAIWICQSLSVIIPAAVLKEAAWSDPQVWKPGAKSSVNSQLDRWQNKRKRKKEACGLM